MCWKRPIEPNKLRTRKSGLALSGFLAFVAAFAASPLGAFAASCTTRPPQPTGSVRITRPTLTFQIAPVGDTKIIGVTLTLNQAVVPATYSLEKKAVLYQPAEPLPPGDYTVQCRVLLDGNFHYDKEWQFTVAADAVSDLPEPTARQRAVFEAVNTVRHAIGLPPFALDPSLCAAAQAHSHYLSLYSDASGHDEQIGRPGATGAMPQDRATTFGYGFPIGEDVSGNSSPLVTVPIMGLFDAPYHRLPFLQPEAGALGVGSDGVQPHLYQTTLDFGQSSTDAVVVSPFPDQTHVPTRWDGNETPSPLRIYTSPTLPVGYAIVFAHFGAGDHPIVLSSATLTTDAGQTVPLYINTPRNDDHLSNAAILIPKQPLLPGATYHVSVQATTDDGEDISRAWNFTTSGGAVGNPGSLEAARLHAAADPLPVQVVYAQAHLNVTFARSITRLQCIFDDLPAPTKSSPPVFEADGAWHARYAVPASARSYRLVMEQGGERHVVTSQISPIAGVAPAQNGGD